jgi:hypothetical protein
METALAAPVRSSNPILASCPEETIMVHVQISPGQIGDFSSPSFRNGARRETYFGPAQIIRGSLLMTAVAVAFGLSRAK